MNVTHRFVIISAVYITCLITANIIAVKVIGFGSVVMPAAIIIFPLSYIFGDILTEVYGYRWARRVIWLGFACNLIFVVFAYLGQLLPAASFWNDQQAYESILGYAPRLLLASVCGYLVGEFVNSFIMAKMKVATKGRWLWARTIGSTVFGQGLDTALFIVIAYIGTASFVPLMILYHWLIKVAIEALATPVTYKTVNYLKRKENVDTYDRDTDFNPFKL
ncbi:MAG: queuosine precursor transporter [Dehalococcoidales bacterium]|nr:queuosine precursor transporter [Dehalococcoidales bacterium]